MKPLLRCENCDKKNKLRFNPLKNWQFLEEVKCSRCKQFAYWSHYFTFNELVEFFNGAWSKRYLKEFISFKFKQTGRKGVHVRSL